MSPQEEFHAKLSAEGEIYFTPAFWAELSRRFASDAFIRKLFEAMRK